MCCIEIKTGLERLKEIVGEMNDFESRENTMENYLAFRNLRRELSVEFNNLLYTSEEDWREANRYIDDNLKCLFV